MLKKKVKHVGALSCVSQTSLSSVNINKEAGFQVSDASLASRESGYLSGKIRIGYPYSLELGSIIKRQKRA